MKCGSSGVNQADCSSGGSNVNACLGKKYCFIFVDGGKSFIQGGGKNGGLDWDIKHWLNWIDQLILKYGSGEVGFIIFETDGSDANNGADMIHQTLQTLQQKYNYNGTISLIGASAGAAAIFVYFNRADTNQYASSDAHISAFIAMDAPSVNGDSTSPPQPEQCYGGLCGSGDDIYEQAGESGFSGWDGDTSGAADYVRRNGINGVYAWATNDPLSSEISGGGARKTYSIPAPSDAHAYIEGSPYSMPGVCLLCALPNP